MKNIIKQLIILIFVALIVFFLFYNCSGNKTETTKEETVKTETVQNPSLTNDCRTLYLDAIKNDSIILSATQIDVTVANKAIKAFADFAQYCNTDSLAPVFLLKAGQIAQSINNMPQAKISYEKVIEDFPNFKNRGAAMFLLAQLYDEPQYLNNEDKALELYNRIISLYGGTEWAANAAAARDLLGKSDDQIVKEFLKKNKGK